mmetsp:Transcript_51028/g.150422  ORF Transcript_51028/g.150422 Transcript_51028/m.150422 type:complete len:445 (-) Transcript_51028:1118-2452(-)
MLLRGLPNGLLQTLDGARMLAAQLLHQSLVGGSDAGHLARMARLQILHLLLLLLAHIVHPLLVALAEGLPELRECHRLLLGEVRHDLLVVGRELRHQLLALLAGLLELPAELGAHGLELRLQRAPRGVRAAGELGEALLEVPDLSRMRLFEARELGAQGLQLLLAVPVLGGQRGGHLPAERFELGAVPVHDGARVALQLRAHLGQLLGVFALLTICGDLLRLDLALKARDGLLQLLPLLVVQLRVLACLLELGPRGAELLPELRRQRVGGLQLAPGLLALARQPLLEVLKLGLEVRREPLDLGDVQPPQLRERLLRLPPQGLQLRLPRRALRLEARGALAAGLLEAPPHLGRLLVQLRLQPGDLVRLLLDLRPQPLDLRGALAGGPLVAGHGVGELAAQTLQRLSPLRHLALQDPDALGLRGRVVAQRGLRGLEPLDLGLQGLL